MRHWARVAAGEIFGTPVVLVTLMMMACVWYAAAGIYWVALQVPRHGEFGALMLLGANVLSSYVVVFVLAGLWRDLRELRLPRARPLRAGALAVILGVVFAAPCVLVWWLNGSDFDILMIGLGSVAGTTGALLWRFRSAARPAPGTRVSGAAFAPSLAPQRPAPWRAVRVALGPPYAPASWQRRVIELAAVCAVVAGAPALVVFYESSMRPRTFTVVLHASEFVGFLVAIGLCWAWPLSRLIAIFNPQRGALTELALLPGMGDGRQQLRRLYLVALGVPGAGLTVLLISALVLLTLQHQPDVAYLKLAMQFLMIPLVTLPILIGQIARSHTPAQNWSVTVLMVSQIWTFSYLVWSGMWDVSPTDPAVAHTFRWVTVWVVLAGLTVIGGFSVHALRKLLRRPHPFVEVSS